MNKKGFTLVEILAVVVILSIILSLATLGVMNIRRNSLQKLVDTKISNLESSAVLYGQENQDELDAECKVGDETYSSCKKMTVRELIEKDYYKSEETNNNGEKDLINNVTRESMLDDKVIIFKKNNRVYSKYVDADVEVKFGFEDIKKACNNGDNLINCVKKLDEDNNSYDSGVTVVDDSIRYSGANPNNFICFGSNASTCPHANLYRIIGIFKKSNHGVDAELLKLIKYDYEYGFGNIGTGTNGAYYHYIDPESGYRGIYSKSINGYWYNSSQINDWSSSTLNSYNLNNSFLNYLGTWANYIVPVTWKVGGASVNNLLNVSFDEAYRNEVLNSTKTVNNVKVGLVYVTDYAYAADKSVWNTSLSNYNSHTSLNWMYMGVHEWTITRSNEVSNKVFTINADGKVFDRVMPNYCAIRPSFYISSSVKYLSGVGSKTDPIRIG